MQCAERVAGIECVIVTTSYGQSAAHELPLCPNQERSLLVRELLGTQALDCRPNILALAFCITGNLNFGAISAALDEIVRRHPSVRVRFHKNSNILAQERAARLLLFAKTGMFDPGLYGQSIADEAHVSIATIDLMGANKIQHNSAICKTIADEQGREFDYSQPPLLRATLIRTHSDRQVLVIFIDHLAADAWSLTILKNEIELLYYHFADGTPYPLAPVRFSYPDFAVWQSEAHEAGEFNASIQYWEKQWQTFGSSQLLPQDLPFVLCMEKAADGLFASEKLLMTEELSASVDAFLLTYKVTLHMFCFATFAVLLAMYSGKRRVPIWCHFANRNQPRTYDNIGFYSNSHVVGVDLARASDIQTLVHQVRETIIECLSHSEVPFPLVWKHLSCRSEYPSFIILLNTEAQARRETVRRREHSSASTLVIEELPFPETGAPRFAHLGLYITRKPNGIILDIQYQKARFQRDSVRRMLNTFGSVAADMVANPHKSLPDLTRPLEYR